MLELSTQRSVESRYNVGNKERLEKKGRKGKEADPFRNRSVCGEASPEIRN